MTTITITPDSSAGSRPSFRATDGVRQSVGATVGSALDGLSVSFGMDEPSAVVIVQHFGPDSSFTAEQQRRLGQLQAARSEAIRDGIALSAADEAELRHLVESELRASTQRIGEMADRLGR